MSHPYVATALPCDRHHRICVVCAVCKQNIRSTNHPRCPDCGKVLTTISPEVCKAPLADVISIDRARKAS